MCGLSPNQEVRACNETNPQKSTWLTKLLSSLVQEKVGRSITEMFTSIFVSLQNVQHQVRVWNGPDDYLHGGYIYCPSSIFIIFRQIERGKYRQNSTWKKEVKDKTMGLVYLFVHSTWASWNLTRPLQTSPQFLHPVLFQEEQRTAEGNTAIALPHIQSPMEVLHPKLTFLKRRKNVSLLFYFVGKNR